MMLLLLGRAVIDWKTGLRRLVTRRESRRGRCGRVARSLWGKFVMGRGRRGDDRLGQGHGSWVVTMDIWGRGVAT